MDAHAARGNHFITSAIEHHAVLHAAHTLEARGAAVTIVPVGDDGLVRPSDIRSALRENTVLFSVMHANN